MTSGKNNFELKNYIEMEIQCLFFPDNNKFIEQGYIESLGREWEYHKGEFPLLESEMEKTEGYNVEWLDEKIEESCTISKKLFKQLKIRDIIKPMCFIPKKETKLSVEICSFVKCLEYAYIVTSRTFNSEKNATLHLHVIHEDFDFDFRYQPKP